MLDPSYDVVVMGGGPAGSSAASFLRLKGHSVLVLEKEIFPRFMIGESLLPAIWELWAKLGVIEKLEAVGYPVKRGVLFRLEKEDSDYAYRTDEFPEYFDRPWAYHVDRASYDQIMLDNAREKGADVLEGCPVKEVLFEDERAVGVRYHDHTGKEHEVGARVVIDATGRSSFLARKLGRRYPNKDLVKVAYYTHFEGADRRTAEDGSTMTDIHTTDGGWIWCIPLCDDVTSVGVVLDKDYVQANKGNPQLFLDRAIGSCDLVSGWLKDATQSQPVRNVASISYLNDNFVGDGFLMVGDASMFIDPIFSAGVTLATRGAEIASEVVSDALNNGDTSEAALKPFEEKLRHPVGNLIKIILNWYEVLQKQNRDHIFTMSQESPLLRERLIVLLSGGYEKADLEEFV